MSETPDSLFLKAAVAKGLIDAELANSVYHDCQSQGRSAADLLIERGVLTAYNVDLIAKEVIKASGPRIIGGFQLGVKLGQGGMGAVYRATQLSIGREVALKLMAPEVARNTTFAERFLREAIAMGAINHPNVITCFDAGQDGKMLYMALELMTGGDADQLARSHKGILPVVRACEIVRDGAAGLCAIHRAGLIHRDIKPANIFLGEDGTAKLADLGLARPEASSDQMTRTGTAMGTPAYMSPEQAEGVADLDIRSDIYALGATLYALVTGQPPFSGQSAYAVVARVINDPLPDPRTINPNIPEPVAQVIRAAMHKDRRKRQQTPSDLLHQLNRCLDELLAAGLTATSVGVLPPSLVGVASHPTPHTHAGPGVNRHHRSPATAKTATAATRNWLIGGVVCAAVAVAVVTVVLTDGLAPSSHAPSPGEVAEPTARTPTGGQGSLPANPPAHPAKTTVDKPETKPGVAASRRLLPGDPWAEFSSWCTATSALSPDRQVATVIAALQELNPGFDGRNQAEMDPSSGSVTALAVSAKGLSDLRPVHGLHGLQSLTLRGGSAFDRAPLAHLEGLRGLSLTRVQIAGTSVEDLSPLAGMPLVDVDISGSTVRDLSPLVMASLRSIAFSTENVRGGIAGLRALTAVESIGITWDERLPAANFWRRYDAGEMPGVAPTSAPPVAGSAPEPTPVTAPATAVLGLTVVTKPPLVLAIEPLVIPESATAKVREVAKVFNEAATKLIAGITQRRKEAVKPALKTVSEEYDRAAQGIRKDPSLLTLVQTLSQVKAALERGAGPRDPLFADPLIPRASSLALAEWRSAIEPLEAEASTRAEERRVKTVKALDPLVGDSKSGASELVTQLKAMEAKSPEIAAESALPPVAGVIWSIDCMTALPHDTVLRDLMGIHPPARVVGEITETPFGKALRADGRSSQVTVTLKRPLAARTFMAWVYVTSQTLSGGVIGVQSPDGSRFETLMYLGGQPGWGVNSNNGKRTLTTGKGGWNEGLRRHLTLVVDGANRTVLLDGKPIGSDQGGEPEFPAGSELIIGKRNSGRDERHFAGLIDGVLVFERALSLEEIHQVMRWQTAAADQIRSNVRDREWLNVPLANSDFAKVSSTGRPIEWVTRGDGIGMAQDEGNRFLRLDMNKAGQDARAAKQQVRLDPTWRALRAQVRVRVPKLLEPVNDGSPLAGMVISFEDPSGALPTVRRVLNVDENAKIGEWIELTERSGWPIPPGYSVMTVDCELRGNLGSIDLDDVKISALIGKP